MTQPVKNTCTPSSVYGGFDHTLFLGCSVMSFSTSLGWNEQISECTIQLVEDNCPAPVGKPKHYWDSSLNHQTTTNPDPGFIGNSVNIVGCPAYFRMADFEFSGIIQNWVESNSQSGRPVYTVKLVSPQQIIEGVQLIINEYAGGVGNTPNLFNCFGYMESFGSTCPQTYLSALPPTPDNYELGDGNPDGALFGTPAGGFGGALVNENGMQWNRIATAFNILANSVPRAGNVWNGGSGGGRVVFKGTSSNAGYGLVRTLNLDGFTEYYVDISELPSVPTYWRLNGVSVGLLDTIKTICEESGYDFYLELCLVKDGTLDSSGLTKFIKVRTVSRAIQPNTFTSIADFAESTGTLQSSYGRELRNEITSSFVIGGSRETVYQIEQDNDPEGDGQPSNEEADDIIVPFFGLDSDGNMIVPEKDADDYWEFTTDTFGINERLKVLSLPAEITIHELELLFALGGYDSWLTYEAEASEAGAGTDIGTAIAAEDIIGIFGGKKLVGVLAAGDLPAPRDFVNAIGAAFPGAAGQGGQISEDIQAIYDWLLIFAREYYGRQFAVRVPYTCAYQDNESGTVIHSELPSNEGWTEFASIVGLARNSLAMEKFKNESYKYTPIVRFDNASGLAFNKLDQNDIHSDASQLWVRGEVEEMYVYHDAATLAIPRVVLKLNEPVTFVENDAENPQAARLLVDIMVRRWSRPRADVENAIKRVGAQQLFGVLPYIPVMPNAVSFSLKSNITTYGPWYNPGPAGQVVVQRDEGLVPWEYSDVATMAQAGQSIADAQVTNMQVGETGSVSVAGYPTVPLGAEIGAVAGGFFGAGTNLIENRAASTGSFSGTHVIDGSVTINYGFFSYGGSWTGLYGPNVTGITVQVDANGVNTQYEFRTFTPKFGKFAKYNAERLKQIGKQKLQAQKQMKAILAQKIRRGITSNQATMRDRARAGRIFDPGTPHECFVAQTYQFNGKSRTLVANESLFNIAVETKGDYEQKAFMSLDGLLRPVSMDGDGGLPRYIKPKKGRCQHITSAGAQTPVLKGDGNNGVLSSTEYYAGKRNIEEIDIDYLNPFSNPAGMARSKVVENRGDGTGLGHDIDIVGRGTGLDGSGITMPIAGYNNENKADYTDDIRTMALRGPILLQQWGYDLDGRPVPNSVDTESAASGGEFETEGLTNKFLEGWLGKSHTWPVATLDLRLDRDRGVWTAPPAPRTLTVRLCENLCIGGSALAQVLNSKTVYDDTGEEIESPMIYVTDVVNNPLRSGDLVLAGYDTYECKYYVANNQSSDMFPFQLVQCMPYGGPGRARQLVNTGNSYSQTGEPFDVYAGIPDTWGPAPSGYTGWAKWVNNNAGGSGNCEDPTFASIIFMDRVAEFIEFETLADFGPAFSKPAVAKANVSYYWKGHDPDDGFNDAYVVLPAQYTQKDCFPMGTKGTAIFDAKATNEAFATGCVDLIYNIMDINTLLQIRDTSCGTDSGAFKETRFLIVGTGLETEELDGCRRVLRSKIRLQPSDTCLDYTQRITSGEKRFQKLTLGKGLFLVQDEADCDLKIGAGIFATGINECVVTETEGSNVLQSRAYNTIQFGKGISKAHVDNCTFKIGAGIHGERYSECIAEEGESPKAESVYSTVKFGAGLNVNHAGDCTLEVGLGLKVNGYQTTHMTFGTDCFEVTETECGVNVYLKNDVLGQSVEYVSDVECSSGDIIVHTKYLEFSDCGLFMGVSEITPPPEE